MLKSKNLHSLSVSKRIMAVQPRVSIKFTPHPKQKAEKILFTPKGLMEIQSRLKFLKEIKRPQVLERIMMAKDLGGISENSEYSAALEEQEMVENRISFLERMIKKAQVVPDLGQHKVIGVGAKVELEIEGKVTNFTIVGRMETDPINGLISNESPLGRALLGKKIGEVAEVEAPQSHYKCRIVGIK